jgi:glutathione S-transferase
MSEKVEVMECSHAREHFPAFDEKTFPTGVLGHLEACEGCRAELAEYRKLEAQLGSLAAMDIQPPAWLLGTVTERVAEAARRRAVIEETRKQLGRATTVTTRQIGEHRVAAGSALGLAVLAGAVLFGRRRHGVKVAA